MTSVRRQARATTRPSVIKTAGNNEMVGPYHWQAVVDLAVAIITAAVDDFTATRYSEKKRRFVPKRVCPHIKDRAKAFFDDAEFSEGSVSSFDFCCELIGTDKSVVMRAIRERRNTVDISKRKIEN